MATSESVQAWLGYLFVDELRALKTLAQGLPAAPVVVNIGAGGGTSGLAFMESRGDLRLYTIDIQDESSPFGCLEGERQVMAAAGFALGHDRRWSQIHGDSKQVGQRWQAFNGYPPQVDFVFIDGDHSYEGCAGDIQAWLPNVKPGGLLAVHDYGKDARFAQPDDGNVKPHPMAWPGVDRAVDELLIPDYPIVLHIDTLIVFRIGGSNAD